jgi:hypothetical protein
MGSATCKVLFSGGDLLPVDVVAVDGAEHLLGGGQGGSVAGLATRLLGPGQGRALLTLAHNPAAPGVQQP